MVKRSIEQNLRIKNFQAINGNYETNAVVKNQGTKQREQRTLGDCSQWKANGQCSKGDNCSFRHDINKRAKTTQPNPSTSSPTRQNETNASRTRSPRGRSPSGRMSRLPCKDYVKGTCTNSFCEKWHPPECLFYKSENGCRFGEKCSYAHPQVDEQPSKRSQNNGDKSAVAMLKITRQLVCVSQDMEPPKSPSISRKSSDIQKPKPTCKIHETRCTSRKSSRSKSFAWNDFCPGDPHQRNPNAPKFEDRSQEETEWQERCAREAAWRLAESILKNKAAFFSPSVDAQDQQKGLEFCWDGYFDDVEKSYDSHNRQWREVQTHEEATVYVKELDLFLTMKVLENTPAVLSLGKLCDEHGYSYEWINSQKPHLIKNGIRI